MLDAIAGVDGWLSADQARGCTRRCINGAGEQIVEIGSFRGRSTIVLASAAPEGVVVVAIDPHAGNDRGPQEISGFEVQAADDHEVFMANLIAAGVADACGTSGVQQRGPRRGCRTHRVVVHRRSPPLRAGTIRHSQLGESRRPGGTMLIHDSFSSVGVTLAIARE